MLHTVEAWGAPLVALTLLALGLVLGFALGYLVKRNRRAVDTIAREDPHTMDARAVEPDPVEEPAPKVDDVAPEPGPSVPPPEPPVPEEEPASLKLEPEREELAVSSDREKPKPPPRREPPSLEEPAPSPTTIPMAEEPEALKELRDSDRTFFILMLHEGEGVTETLLSERLDLSKGAVRDAVDRLEEHELVERVRDGGKTRIRFTYEAPV